ncbi:hypothetical protein [Piscinibacter sakaiensis]|uniref:hypothetical protein n=1 Tax=Piscinibacter sakaiensis TaxID=1547922 RepID=UPI003AABE59F
MGVGASSGSVRRRHVFFIAGFDPKSPRYYHALYRREAGRQTAVSGLPLQVGRTRSRPTTFSTSWAIDSPGSTPVSTVYEMLQWDDIVRDHWASSATRVLIDGVRAVVFGLRDGAVQRLFQLFRPPVYASLLPLAVMTFGSLLAAAVGVAVAAGVAAAAPGWPDAAGPVTGVGASLLTIALLIRVVHRIQITWLLRLLRFTHLQAIDRVPALDARLSAFAARIAEVAAAEDAADEILVVGHSVGASLAIGVLARLADQQAAGSVATVPTLLSLGHCMPLLGTLSPANGFRRDLQAVAEANIDWLDITAPIDWAAFPGIDPVRAAGLPPVPAGWHPRLLSPRFHTLFSPAAYARLKANRFKVHLQYLMASERTGRYDYFAITAGPQSLRQRFDDADSDVDR